MAELNFIVMSHGLIPMDDEARIWLDSQKKGEVAKAKISIMRNGKFFKKWWSLIGVAFDWWRPNPDVNQINGVEVSKNKERFRKDIVIRTGRYDLFVNTKNEVKAEPRSLKWASMDELEFTKLYDDTITVLLKTLPSHIKEEDLRNAEASVLEYA